MQYLLLMHLRESTYMNKRSVRLGDDLIVNVIEQGCCQGYGSVTRDVFG